MKQPAKGGRLRESPGDLGPKRARTMVGPNGHDLLFL